MDFKSFFTYFAILGFIAGIVFFARAHTRQHHVDNHWVSCGEGFFYDLDSADKDDWYLLEQQADKCSGTWGIWDHQSERKISKPTSLDNPGEFNSIWGNPVGYIMYSEAVIIYDDLLVINWEMTPQAHRLILHEAMELRDNGTLSTKTEESQ